MTRISVDQFFDENQFIRATSEDQELDALRMAILIEDIFEVVLSDEQIAHNDLHNPETLRTLLSRPL